MFRQRQVPRFAVMGHICSQIRQYCLNRHLGVAVYATIQFRFNVIKFILFYLVVLFSYFLSSHLSSCEIPGSIISHFIPSSLTHYSQITAFHLFLFNHSIFFLLMYLFSISKSNFLHQVCFILPKRVLVTLYCLNLRQLWSLTHCFVLFVSPINISKQH